MPKPGLQKARAWAAIILIIVAACLLIIFLGSSQHLVLTDNDTNEIYAKFPLEKGEGFSVSFIHSVNKSPIREYYLPAKNGFELVKSEFHGFGAGVQTETAEGQDFYITEDGTMVMTGGGMIIPSLNYRIGKIHGHSLHISGETIDLRKLCGASKSVRFEIKRKLNTPF
ncbi:DUF1850 domain-containing protein [Clostridiaceae bacterium OttesenSCG-928-D20]|nr:DUF1850 domain-containing protein [Clostridiaceae bacterium OttesenSCG-928-D20]